MDIIEYKTAALRTASEDFHGNQFPSTELTEAMEHVAGQIEEFDAFKKGLFYGKTYPGFTPKKANEKTWDGINKDLLHAGLGLVTEGYEFLEKVVEFKGELTEDQKAALASELGDSLWYANIATRPLGTNLGVIADGNIAKLTKRYPDKFSLDQAVNKSVEAEDALVGEILAPVEDTAEYGWLIERADSPASAPVYFRVELGHPSWTENVFEAIRFARQIDAENISKVFLPGSPVRIAEHGFGGL